MLIKRVVTEALKDGDDDDDATAAAGRAAPVEAPDDDIDARDDDDDDAYEEDASVEAPDERGVSGESGDDDDDDDGLKIYDDCRTTTTTTRPSTSRIWSPSPSTSRRGTTRALAHDEDGTGGTFDEKRWTTTWAQRGRSEWTGGGGYSQKCKWEKKLKCPCKVRIVHPADQPGVTYFQERLGHVPTSTTEDEGAHDAAVKIRDRRAQGAKTQNPTLLL
ncbi:hypothetical protein SO694_00033112 [Aureococcus anophagefferens]|uniref:WRKY domain-containing protein n=1 Tax=Aureococcus anophagefferens TaxID=44056 RepID=A0ABR1FK66_AURAN